jgi:hypothetical protein
MLSIRTPVFDFPAVLSVLGLLAGGQVFANVSLVLAPGTTAVVQTPAVAPFTSLGDTRLELRLHDWSLPASESVIFWNAGFIIRLQASGELCASNNMDALPNYGGTMCADVSGRSDVTIRVQRDTVNRQLLYEVRGSANDWKATTYCGMKSYGSTRNTFPCPISTVHLGSWAGPGGIGSSTGNFRLSWIKWHSSVIPVGSGMLGEGAPADLADWRFEGDTASQGSIGQGSSMSPAQPQGASGALFIPTPAFPPACFAGRQQTFRAGFPARLDGSGSYSLEGGGALAYSWRQISGPSEVSWSGESTAQPAVAGLLFGSYVFQLTVADASGRSVACTVKHGAVATDDNGVVIASNPEVDTLLGPMIRYGANPWPWFDDRHKAAADAQIANLDTYYGAYWDPGSPVYGSAASQAAWMYNSAPANYYDNVAGFYAMYYRSGIDDYLNAARKLADRFWESPLVKRGASCDAWAGMASCYPARSLSVLGLVMRALDGRPDMWPGLRIIFASYRDYYLNLANPQWGMWDTREMAYHLATVSYCAIFDPDLTSRQSCKASIAKSFTTTWTRARAADGSFPALYHKTASWETGSSVSLTRGSRTVTGVGTNWNAGMLQCSNASGRVHPCRIWFTNTPGDKPVSNAGGDPVVYTATFVSTTQLTLDRPYEGNSGAHGWALPEVNAGLVGYGVQPFIQGILGVAFDFAARAIADSDPSAAALARSYNVGIAHWLRNYGYWPAAKGMYYGAGFANCQAPISDSDVFCTAGNSWQDARVLNAEPMRSVMLAYEYSGDVALKTFGDTLYSAMFSKPGTGGPDPDGYYVDSLNDGNGWYMTGVPPIGTAPKYFGMFFGFSSLSAWPAYRIGGPQPQTGGNATVPAPVRAIPGAARLRITTTAR